MSEREEKENIQSEGIKGEHIVSEREEKGNIHCLTESNGTYSI